MCRNYDLAVALVNGSTGKIVEVFREEQDIALSKITFDREFIVAKAEEAQCILIIEWMSKQKAFIETVRSCTCFSFVYLNFCPESERLFT